MMKKVLLIVFDLLCLGVCLFFSLSAYVKYREDYVKVPVASHQLFQRTKLNKEDLLMVDVPRAYLTQDVCTDPKEILDKYVRLSYSLAKGSLIYRGALEDDIGDLPSTLLNEGEVSYDLYANEVKINTGNLAVNMSVNIYLTIKNSVGALSDLLLEDCRVIGLYDPQGRMIRDYEEEPRILTVCIAVEKEHVKLLNKALMVGSLSVFTSDHSYAVDVRSKLNEGAEVLSYLQ
ncbi:MAG: hypothetical protein IIZ28_02760 [Erysipelotrichaceae bacterium]|nr:hypothetical protein [Erysipelotrichaceae bacterium]